VRLRKLFIPGTYSADGLNTTTYMIQQQGRHDDGVPVVVIFLTDGKSNEPSLTVAAARNLHITLPQVTAWLYKQESRAVARIPRDVAAVLFGSEP